MSRKMEEIGLRLFSMSAEEMESLVHQLGSVARAERYLGIESGKMVYAWNSKFKEITKIKRLRSKNKYKKFEEAFQLDKDRVELIDTREKMKALEDEIFRLEGMVAGQSIVVNNSIKKSESARSQLNKIKLVNIDLKNENEKLKDEIKELRKSKEEAVRAWIELKKMNK